MAKDKPKAADGGTAAESTGGTFPLIVAVLLGATPLTLLGLFNYVEKYAAALSKQSADLSPVAQHVAKIGDPGLVAVGMGAAIIGILGATILRGSARVSLPIAMILSCGWATALVLFLLLPR